ncbi:MULTISPECIES: DJ-1/PfpI family protein [Ralstonia]|jgi:transcriptional regulator GlxA family with amidase domain|uniref:Isonitrile hydratase n=1 Tax=Ralstonia flaminis TaxID=3058597 RepID=A0ABN9JS11_9RALS|nr:MULTISPECIES: DJ-1/PfpI family protein [unclassified Ralstonia]CAJ0822528.1 Isonitrile hydratase [Ralstonia sp. LMG 18101]
MKQIALIAFEQFTDIDLFLMWDILGRNRKDWQVRILGKQPELRSAHGLLIPTHGRLEEASRADVVLFSSGKEGVPAAMSDAAFMGAFQLDPSRQLIGSICGGALILARLGLLAHPLATTHPDAREALRAEGVEPDERPFVNDGNVATAGGCLAALYLVGWVAQRLYGTEKCLETLRPVLPSGQYSVYEKLIVSSLEQGRAQHA